MTGRIKQRWIDLLYRVATGARRTRNLLTPVGAIIFALFTAIFVFAGLSLDRILGLPPLFSAATSRVIGIPTMLVGLVIIGWSALHFHRVRGTPVPFNPPPELVVTGPYAYSRNPMLTGVFLLLLGIGFATRSIMLITVFTPLYILANAWELKHIEEPELVRRLGPPYIRYRSITPMFIPRRQPYAAKAESAKSRSENDQPERK